MSTHLQVTPLAIEDYEAIEDAVMETRRGRWFLTEYARRNRNADTSAVMEVLERIEKTIRRERAVPDIDRIRLDLADMAEAIFRTKQEISQMKLDTEHGGRFSNAGQELDAIVDQTEVATNDILLAAEGIQEVAWTLREAGAADDLCDRLDAHATEVYTACSFQDLTGQRTRKVVTVLRYLESRINAMNEIWGLSEEAETAPAPSADAPFDPFDQRPDAHLLNGPQLQGRGIDQSDVDGLMVGADGTVTIDQPSFEVPSEPEFAVAEVETEIVDESAVEPEADAPDATEPSLTAAPAADVFAAPLDDADLSGADVFAGEDLDRVAADVFGRTDDAEADTLVVPTTVVVGNTVTVVATAAEPMAQPTPQLVVVPAVDPISELDPRSRLVTFG